MTFMYKMRARFCMMQRFARQHRASSIERVCHHVRFLLVIACHTYKEWTLSTRSGEGRLAEMFILSSRVHRAAFSCAKSGSPGLPCETRNSSACRFHRRFLWAFERAINVEKWTFARPLFFAIACCARKHVYPFPEVPLSLGSFAKNGEAKRIDIGWTLIWS